MKRKTQLQPEQFVPDCPAQFIGGARAVATILAGKAERLHTTDNATAKLLLFGHPGTGKTRLAEMFARQLTGEAGPIESSVMIESVNGRNVNIDLIRRWQDAGRYLAVFSKWSVKIVNEIDTAPAYAQDLLLTYLDQLPAHTAFIGTSNLELRQLADRFQTRLQQFKVEAPTTEEITALVRRWDIGKHHLATIAVGSGGNVRAALLDAQSILDAERATR